MNVGREVTRAGRDAPVIANPGATPEPVRRIVLLTKLKRTTLRLGAVTQAFFRKGDELAASEFENVPHDDPMLVPRKLGFRTFDRVPRRRAPVAVALLLLASIAAIVLGWRSIRDLPARTGPAARSLASEISFEWVRLKAFVGSRWGGR